MKKILPLLIVLGLAAPVAIAPAFADDVALQDAGSASAQGSASETPKETPADKLHDPISDTKAAVEDVKQARRQGWAMLVFALATMAAKLVGRVKKWPKLAFLNKGRAAVIVGAVSALVFAAYNALADGGSLYAAGYAGVLGVAAYWNSHSSDASQT
jgi:hypothetical protein